MWSEKEQRNTNLEFKTLNLTPDAATRSDRRSGRVGTCQSGSLAFTLTRRNIYFFLGRGQIETSFVSLARLFIEGCDATIPKSYPDHRSPQLYSRTRCQSTLPARLLRASNLNEGLRLLMRSSSNSVRRHLPRSLPEESSRVNDACHCLAGLCETDSKLWNCWRAGIEREQHLT